MISKESQLEALQIRITEQLNEHEISKYPMLDDYDKETDPPSYVVAVPFTISTGCKVEFIECSIFYNNVCLRDVEKLLKNKELYKNIVEDIADFLIKNKMLPSIKFMRNYMMSMGPGFFGPARMQKVFKFEEDIAKLLAEQTQPIKAYLSAISSNVENFYKLIIAEKNKENVSTGDLPSAMNMWGQYDYWNSGAIDEVEYTACKKINIKYIKRCLNVLKTTESTINWLLNASSCKDYYPDYYKILGEQYLKLLTEIKGKHNETFDLVRSKDMVSIKGLPDNFNIRGLDAFDRWKGSIIQDIQFYSISKTDSKKKALLERNLRDIEDIHQKIMREHTENCTHTMKQCMEVLEGWDVSTESTINWLRSASSCKDYYAEYKDTLGKKYLEFILEIAQKNETQIRNAFEINGPLGGLNKPQLVNLTIALHNAHEDKCEKNFVMKILKAIYRCIMTILNKQHLIGEEKQVRWINTEDESKQLIQSKITERILAI